MESLTLFSHLVIAKLHLIINCEDFRKPKLIYDILSQE
jgi:hypothetical protein